MIMLPHQQRVVDEKTELDKKISMLSDFIENNPVFDTVDDAEQDRLKEQLAWMVGYNNVLVKRIAAFAK